MKFFNYILSSAAVATLVLIGCSMTGGNSISDGNIKDATVKKTVKISNFSKIDAATGIRVIYSQGKYTGTAQIATTPSAEKYLKVYVKDGTLVARYENKGNNNIKGPSIVTVSSTNLSEVDLSSAARLQVNGNLDISSLEIDMSSASKATFNDITAKEIEIDLSSSANVEIGTANVDKLDAELSSASRLEVSKAVATNLFLETSSAAKILVGYFNGTGIEADASSGSNISVSDMTATKAYAEASSGSKVTLKGRCEHVNKDASSGGKVDISQLEVPNLPQKSSRKHQPRNP